MPKNKSAKTHLHSLINNGHSLSSAVGQMRKHGFSEKAIHQAVSAVAGGIRDVGGLIGQFKSRKGGVQIKGGRMRYINDGNPPSLKQFNRMKNLNRSILQNKKPRSRYMTNRKPVGMQMMQAVRNRARPRRMEDSNNAVTSITHTEIVGNITGNGGGTSNPAVYFYPINAGLTELFQWGAGVMSNWTHYSIRAITLKLESNCASTDAGRWGMGFDYDPYTSTSSVTSIKDLSRLHHVRGDMKDHLYITFNVSKLTKNKLRVRQGAIPIGQDGKEYDASHLYIVVESSSDTNIGELIINYTFDMSTPNIMESSISSQLLNSTANTDPAVGIYGILKGTSEAAVNSPVTYDFSTPNVINMTFNQRVDAFVTFWFRGTNFNDIAAFSEPFFDYDWTDFLVSMTATTTQQTLITIVTIFTPQLGDIVTYGYLQLWGSFRAGDVLTVTDTGPDGSAYSTMSYALINVDEHTPSYIDLGQDPGAIRAIGGTLRHVKTKKVGGRDRPTLEEKKEYVDIEKSDDEFDKILEPRLNNGASSEPVTIRNLEPINTRLVKQRSIKPGEGIKMQKGGNCDENALVCIILLMLVGFGLAQIRPPATLRPTTSNPTILHTIRPTRNPTFNVIKDSRAYIRTTGNSTCLMETFTKYDDAFGLDYLDCDTLLFTHAEGIWSGIIQVTLFSGDYSSLIVKSPALVFSPAGHLYYSLSNCKHSLVIQQVLYYNITRFTTLQLALSNLASWTGSAVPIMEIMLTSIQFNSEYFSSVTVNGTFKATPLLREYSSCVGGTSNCVLSPTSAPTTLSPSTMLL